MKCQGRRCRREGIYHVEIRNYSDETVLHRIYCRAHVDMLSWAMAELLDEHDPTGKLHDYLDVEHANV